MKPTLQSLAANSRLVLTYSGALLLLLAAVILHSGSVAAQPVGTVVNLSYPSQLLAKKSNGAIKVLIQNSTVDNGDLLESQTNTYARIKFVDGSEVTLAPDTQFRIENYSFDKDRPKEDHSVFTLVKGTLRSITGSLGKRSTDRYQLNTPAATIGIRGTNYIARYVPGEDAAGSGINDKTMEANRCGAHHSALTVEVAGGAIYLKNDAGVQQYSTGEFGCAVSYQQAPTVVTENPGIEFNPSFNKSLQCKV